MIKTTTVKLRIMGNVVDYYIQNNIKFEPNKINELPIEKVNPNSHIKIDVVCDVCGKEKKVEIRRYYKSFNNGGYYSCSPSCAKKKTEKTFLDKYGEKNIFKTDIFKEKSKNTFEKKWGASHYRLSSKWKEEYLNTEKEKRKRTITKKFIDENEEVVDIKDDEFLISCDIHGNNLIPKTIYSNRKINNNELCPKCNPISRNVSGKEIKVLNFIKEIYKGEVISSYKIDRKEIDIFIPKLNLGFEFNGLRWHSDEFVSKNYHLNKTNFFKEKNIRIFHIFEDDFDNKWEIIQSMIKNSLGVSKRIYGRQTTLKKIESRNVIEEFLNKNHLQGFVNSNINYGLFKGDELVSLMTFMKIRKILNKKQNGYELVRFCNKLNYSVIGGGSKLFNQFKKDYPNNEVISYCDVSWASGDFYKKIGFTYDGSTKPNYWYVVNKIRESRIKYQKHKLVKEGYDERMTEKEIMKERGFYRIYNCGNDRYVTST